MATLLLLLILALISVFAFAIPVFGPKLSDTRYIAISWMPAAALGLEWVFFEALADVLSYGVILLPLVTCLVSAVTAIIGVKQLVQRGNRRGVLAAATLLAASPALLLCGYIVYSFTQ